MRFFLTALMVLAMGAAAVPAAEKKKAPAPGKSAPEQKQPAAEKEAAPPATDEPAAEQPAAPAEEPQAAAPQKKQPAAAEQKPAGDNLDVTITGEAKDEVPVDKPVPPLDVPFKETVTLSREGQTEKTLKEEIQHVLLDEQTKLVRPTSRQTAASSLVRLPSPPFLRMEVPQGVGNDTALQWELQVVNQNNQTVKTLQGTAWPDTGIFEWDGYTQGVMKLLAGPTYSPVLLVTDVNGKTQRYFGDPVQLDALQYEQDGLLRVEFNNDRLYERRSADFSSEMEPFLRTVMDTVRLRVGSPIRLVIQDEAANNGLSQRRLENWKKLVAEQLTINPDDITAEMQPVGDRGKITAILVLAKP